MQEHMMEMEKIINISTNEVRQKMLSICKKTNETELDIESVSEVMGQMKEAVCDLGRQIIKGYFETRDTKADSIVRDNKCYLNKGTSPKEIVTSLGKIVVCRNYYQHRSGGRSIYPLDEKLGVNRALLMPDVKEIVLFSSAFNTPQESARMFSKCSFIKLHPTQIKHAIMDTHSFMEAETCTIMDKVREEKVPEAAMIACSLDGVNVLLNQKGNKMGPPTQRPVKDNKSAERSAYKNAMCGSIAHYRATQNGPNRIATKYIARMPEKRFTTFKEAFEKELRLPQVQQSGTKLVITDAHKAISGYLKDNPVFEGFHRIIDFYHASEHLSHLAESLFGKTSEQAKKWYTKYGKILKCHKGGVLKLIRSAAYHLKEEKLNQTKVNKVEKQLGYFKNHKEYMDYAQYLENGWPIGSGVIEAACKSLVKQRMCRSGQRWSIDGGQAILTLRSAVKSERWDILWKAFKSEYYLKNAA